MTIAVEPQTALTRIVENDGFSLREKLELLEDLKADAFAMGEDGTDPGFSVADVDEAIARLRAEAERGASPEANLQGGM